ncbi:MAG TPA: phage tail tape measure C-terminal domain-containing protein [Novosphingobium sp.]|nr:phage tail tape measure C-terminal domain-containing protein [Novosphingobium sp.]
MAVKPLVLILDGQTDKLKAALRSGATDLADFSKSTEEVLEGIQQKIRDSLSGSGNDAGAQIGRNLSQQVQEWNRAARNATAGGGNFDPLGGMTSASTLEAAAAQERLAATYREQAAGAAAAQGANEREALALRQVAVASELAAAKADQQAASLRTQAGVLAAMEQAMGRANDTQRRSAEVSGATRNAMRDLSFQISDVSTSLAGGMPPMMVFSQQFGQIIGAFQMMGNEGNVLLRFLGGPWGMALSTAAVAIVPLLSNLDMFKDKVGDAASKLKEQAESTRLAQQAQAVFDATLDGAIARERKLSEELERQLKTRRQLTQEQLANTQQNQVSLAGQVAAARQELQAALAAQKGANASPSYGGGMPGAGAGAARDEAIRRANARVDAAREQLAKVQEAELAAERDVRAARAVQIQSQAKDNATPQAAKQAGFDRQREDLLNKYKLGLLNDGEYQAQLTAIEQASAAAKVKPKKARDTTARDAEAEKKSDAAYDEADFRALAELASIARQNVTDLEELDRLDKAAVDSARDRERRATEEQGRREKWSSADIAALQAKQDEVAEARKQQIDQRTRRDVGNRWTETQRMALNYETQLLQGQSALALTTAQRRELALKILENEKKQAILAVDRKVNDGQLTGEQGMAEVGNINATYALKAQQTNRQYASPIKAWKQELQANTADINASLQQVEVNGLHSLEDGLVGLISGTKSAGQAFKDMATSIIADLARIAIEQMIVKVLGFGLSTGGKVSGKATGGLVGYRTGGLPGYAAGGTRLSTGMISGPGTGTSDSILALVDGGNPIMVSNGEGIVNEAAVNAYWPLIDAMNKGTFPKYADGGLVGAASALAYPALPSPASLRPATPQVIQHFTIDAKGSILANELMGNLQLISQKQATAALAAAPDMTLAELANRQRNTLK